MANEAPKTGKCTLRNMDVADRELCDLYEPKRGGKLKVCCKNCKHFVKKSTFFFGGTGRARGDLDPVGHPSSFQCSTVSVHRPVHVVKTPPAWPA